MYRYLETHYETFARTFTTNILRITSKQSSCTLESLLLPITRTMIVLRVFPRFCHETRADRSESWFRFLRNLIISASSSPKNLTGSGRMERRRKLVQENGTRIHRSINVHRMETNFPSLFSHVLYEFSRLRKLPNEAAHESQDNSNHVVVLLRHQHRYQHR